MSGGNEDLAISSAGEGQGPVAPGEANLSEFTERSFVDDEMLSDLELTDDPDAPDASGSQNEYVPAGANALDLDHESFRDMREEPVDSAVNDEDYAKYFSVPPQLEREWALATEEHNKQLRASAGGVCGPKGGDISQGKPRDIREMARCFRSHISADDRMQDWDSYDRQSSGAVKGVCW
jgi:hypothetical protein